MFGKKKNKEILLKFRFLISDRIAEKEKAEEERSRTRVNYNYQVLVIIIQVLAKITQVLLVKIMI